MKKILMILTLTLFICSAFAKSDDWVETGLTCTSTVEVEWLYQVQNTTGSGVTWPWFVIVDCHWKIYGSATQGPPTWESCVTALRDDTWTESNSGTLYVPNNWYMVYKATWDKETGFQTWYSADLDTTIRRDVDKKDATELTAIASKVSLYNP